LVQKYIASALLFCSVSVFAQKFSSVTGSVIDFESGTPLIGVSIIASNSNLGTISDELGHFSLVVPAQDSITLTFSYIGYESKSVVSACPGECDLKVKLRPGLSLQEIIVSSNSYKEQKDAVQMSVSTLTAKQISKIPMVLGENDALKALQLKPGIPSGSESTTGIFVRGGGADQNLFLLDDAVIYNASHLFGFFSTFNTDLLKNINLYKGGFPARYGGRLSSIIDINSKTGNNQKFEGKGGLGIISSKITLEGPIKKGKSSFLIAGRRTYFDIFTRALNKNNPASNIPNYFFYDFNFKLNFSLGAKDQLSITGYLGKDDFEFTSDFFNFNFYWGNQAGSIKWVHNWSPQFLAKTTISISDYLYNINNRVTGFSFGLGSGINDIQFKTDFLYTPSPNFEIQFGWSGTNHLFEIGRLRGGSSDGLVSFSSGNNLSAFEWGGYFSNQIQINSLLKFDLGLRVSGFLQNQKSFTYPELRLASNFSLSDDVALKASYSGMIQYLHLVRSAGVGLPTDIWYPSTNAVLPERSSQIAVGLLWVINPMWKINLEGYYKEFKNVIEFVDAAQLFVSSNLEDEFAIGDGYARGIELELEKKEGDFTGWIGYTLAFVNRGNFSPLSSNGTFNQKGYFSPPYDRRHDFSLVLFYEISKRIALSATFVYGSGDLAWLPTGRTYFQDVVNGNASPVVPLFEDRNNFRLPAYHRLDIGVNYQFFPTWGESTLSFNLINAYDRRNTFFIFLEPQYQLLNGPDSDTAFNFPEKIIANQVSLFPIIPALTWNFKF
jgi:hypothetical protein